MRDLTVGAELSAAVAPHSPQSQNSDDEPALNLTANEDMSTSEKLIVTTLLASQWQHQALASTGCFEHVENPRTVMAPQHVFGVQAEAYAGRCPDGETVSIPVQCHSPVIGPIPPAAVTYTPASGTEHFVE